MGLEHAPDLPVGIISGRRQGGPDLAGVVGVIIDYRHPADLSLFLKPTVGSGKMFQTFRYLLKGNLKLQAGGNGRQSVGHIVVSCHSQHNVAQPAAPPDHIKLRPGILVVVHILRPEIALRTVPESGHPAGQALRQLLQPLNSAVYNKKSVLGKLHGKLAERMADVLQILEKVQMIFLNI